MKSILLSKKAEQGSRFRISPLFLVVILVCIANAAEAQQTAAQLNTFKVKLFQIMQIVFLMGCGFGVVKVVLGFFGQHKEGALMNLLYLIIGIIVWAAFNYIFSDFGGNTVISI